MLIRHAWALKLRCQFWIDSGLGILATAHSSMAVAARLLGRSFLCLARRIPAKRKWQSQRALSLSRPRPISITSPWQAEPDPPPQVAAQDEDDDADDNKDSDSDSDSSDEEESADVGRDARVHVDKPASSTPSTLSPPARTVLNLDDLRDFTARDLDPEERADYELLDKETQAQYVEQIRTLPDTLQSPEVQEELDQIAEKVHREVDQHNAMNFPDVKLRASERGFWAKGEDDEFTQVPDEDNFKDDDITTPAHAELELQREIREYARIAAWDMPLLSSTFPQSPAPFHPNKSLTASPEFAKPFEPPPLTAPLRFRYTTYMGESHPAAKKVVVEFCTRDLPNLSEQQRIKLIKLVGVRYNPDTDVVKMSCEKFEATAQNKRYLGDMVDNIIHEAKNPADMFEDVPLDFRHHKPKRKAQFPEEWKMKPERVERLLMERKEIKMLEEQKDPVDGMEYVRAYISGQRSGNFRTAPITRTLPHASGSRAPLPSVFNTQRPQRLTPPPR